MATIMKAVFAAALAGVAAAVPIDVLPPMRDARLDLVSTSTANLPAACSA